MNVQWYKGDRILHARRLSESEVSQVLKTDGWAFLNIRNPLCAWATYRGALVGVPTDPGFVSIWFASLLQNSNVDRLAKDVALERCRAQFYPHRVSRLRGMYCFDDLRCAERALDWGSHFAVQNLAELSFAEVSKADRLDSNWITFGNFDEPTRAACFGYWSGIPYPDREPLWEVLVEGRIYVLGTELRERAYSLVERYMPYSTAILEAGRLAAWVGSNLGSTSAFLLQDGDFLELQYYMDMKDAHDPVFLDRLGDLGKSGHPMRPEAVRAFAEDKVRLPDVRAFGFRRPIGDFPFLDPSSRYGLSPGVRVVPFL